MVAYSDEEQLDALKRWWSENGTSVMAGVVLGIGGLLGWRGWTAYQENQAKAASTYYSVLHAAAKQNDAEAVTNNAEVLQDDYASTPYAVLAALEMAKLKGQSGDLESAAEQLRWALDHGAQDSLRNVARIRLARVLTAQGKTDEALELLAVSLPASYTPLVEEIRGDAFVAQGKIEKARKAYDRAIIGASGNIDYLRMKRDDLGDPPSEESSL